MNLVLAPTYENVFKEQSPRVEELLKDIPSYVTISFFSYLNSKLHLDSSFENQVEILKEVLGRQPENIKNNIFKNIIEFSAQNKAEREIAIFTSLYIRPFIHYELINFRNFEIIDTTPIQELNMFKAYMIFVTNKSTKDGEVFKRERNINEGEFFPINTWPLLLAQFDEITHQDSIAGLIRAVCFFNFLQFNSPYSEYVIKFLTNHKKINSWEYVFSFMNILNMCWQNHSKTFWTFSFTCDDKMASLFDSLCVDIHEYAAVNSEKEEDYRLLKSKPLYKSRNHYVVMDWDLIINKIYDGLIFDFFERSGIKDDKDLNSIPKFKRFIGNEITEKFTFQHILEGILKHKYSVLRFPQDDSNGEPDAYFRNGNKILLFEIKDAFFAEKAIKSGSYSLIKDEIDRKYNSSKKGVIQLVKQIEKIAERSIEESKYQELGIKPKNFQIYPILIYTDFHFGMPGISNYLNQEFEKQIKEKGLKSKFRRINQLTFLDLNYLISSFGLFKEFGFLNVIISLHKEIERRRKKHEYKREVQFLFDYEVNHERIIDDIHKIDKIEKMDFRELARLLNLTKGLPEK